MQLKPRKLASDFDRYLVAATEGRLEKLTGIAIEDMWRVIPPGYKIKHCVMHSGIPGRDDYDQNFVFVPQNSESGWRQTGAVTVTLNDTLDGALREFQRVDVTPHGRAIMVTGNGKPFFVVESGEVGVQLCGQAYARVTADRLVETFCEGLIHRRPGVTRVIVSAIARLSAEKGGGVRPGIIDTMFDVLGLRELIIQRDDKFATARAEFNDADLDYFVGDTPNDDQLGVLADAVQVMDECHHQWLRLRVEREAQRARKREQIDAIEALAELDRSTAAALAEAGFTAEDVSAARRGFHRLMNSQFASCNEANSTAPVVNQARGAMLRVTAAIETWNGDGDIRDLTISGWWLDRPMKERQRNFEVAHIVLKDRTWEMLCCDDDGNYALDIDIR